MALTPRLDLRQSQSLVMTPQLQQAIKLLQLNNLELSLFVEQELERNPLLEREDEDNAPLERDRGALDGGNDPDEGGPAGAPIEERVLEPLHGQDETPLDVDYDNSFSSAAEGGEGDDVAGPWNGRGGRHDFDAGTPDLEQTVAGERSLRDMLMEQVACDLDDPIDRAIAVNLIEMLDESGYLTGSLADLASRLGCPLQRVERTLEQVQTFDPPGLFARSLSECLALQLRERNRLDPAMQALLDHLDLLARRDYPTLRRVCGVDNEDLTEMIAEIRALDPKPALAFDHAVAQPVTPDVLMRPGPGGGWMVELNADTLPRVLVNTRYYAEVSKAVRGKEEKSYLSEHFQSANWLVKSLHQRATTILKVASELVRRQDAFFRQGIEHLRPLVLRDIAGAIEMHESTVSRVTANKYIATPRGIFELKYFFTPAINAADGGDTHSAETVRYKIKSLIEKENLKQVLSDDKIVEILRKEGIDIARRTVAKYRESMRIPSSVQRRREKAMNVS